MPGEIFLDAKEDVTVCPKYTLVGLDIDTTGKRLIDEIVQLAAYTPNRQFAQYVIPYMNLNPGAKKRHQVRVITMGFFRMLKNMKTHKVMKTKTEYATLHDFLDWLEEVHKSDPESQGVVLVYHEQRHFIPCMLLTALKRYDTLLDRFKKTTVGFVNSYKNAEQECGKPISYLSLLQLSKVLMLDYSEEREKQMFEGNASVRAQIAHDIFEHLAFKTTKTSNVIPAVDENNNEVKDLELAKEGVQEGGGDGETVFKDQMIVKKSLLPMDLTGIIMKLEDGLNALDEQNEVIVRQNSLRPLFVNYFRGKIYQRVRAVDFRRSLAEHGFDLDKLKTIWDDKKTDGIAEALDSLEELGEKKTELVKIIDSHFDPDKSLFKPAPIKHRRGYQSRSPNYKNPMNPVEPIKN